VSPRGKTVVVVGAGGNIGSQLVPHLARTAGVGRVVLVDHQQYDESNLWTQNVRRRDLGHFKVAVQRRVLREIDATLPVEVFAERVEHVPLGRLRGDVLLSAVDSKAARRTINTITTRLGMAWIDAGVNGDDLLARIDVYRPDPAAPCHLCAWDAADYDHAEQPRPCTAGETTASTNAPSGLGALAASLQALECRKLLAGEAIAVDRRVVVAARTHRVLVTVLTRNPRCRFDHQRLVLEPDVPSVDTCTLADAFALGRRALGTDDVALGVAGQLFASRLSCPSGDCGATVPLGAHLFARLGAVALACAACGGPLAAAGFDALDWLGAADVPADLLAAPLRRVGLRAGDVVSVTNQQRTTHFECGGQP
jgi:molybdopterin/thiamine biosynthesis adenylyltransferase